MPPAPTTTKRAERTLEPPGEGEVVLLQAGIRAEVGVLGHVGRVAAPRRAAAHRLGHRADVMRRGAAAEAEVAHAQLERLRREARDVVARTRERIECDR